MKIVAGANTTAAKARAMAVCATPTSPDDKRGMTTRPMGVASSERRIPTPAPPRSLVNSRRGEAPAATRRSARRPSVQAPIAFPRKKALKTA